VVDSTTFRLTSTLALWLTLENWKYKKQNSAIKFSLSSVDTRFVSFAENAGWDRFCILCMFAIWEHGFVSLLLARGRHCGAERAVS